MVFWLEEAAVEVAMIAAVAVGSFMLVAAVWSQIHERLRSQERRRAEAPQQDAALRGAPRRTSGHPVKHPEVYDG